MIITRTASPDLTAPRALCLFPRALWLGSAQGWLECACTCYGEEMLEVTAKRSVSRSTHLDLEFEGSLRQGRMEGRTRASSACFSAERPC
jgi:hypothetical protein